MREFTTPIKTILFLSSYIPLFGIMALKFWNTGPMILSPVMVPYLGVPFGISALMAGIILGSLLLYLVLMWIIKMHSSRGTTQRPIDKFQKRSDLLTMYLLVYVFVFAGLEFTQLLDLTIFLVFFFILGVLQIRSGYLHVNPMLGLRGYEVYEITSNDKVVLVITDNGIENKLIEPVSETEKKQRNKIEVVPLDHTTFLAP